MSGAGLLCCAAKQRGLWRRRDSVFHVKFTVLH